MRVFEQLGSSGKKGTQGCVCGWLGDASDRCRCTPPMLDRYRARVSGPLLDRIDLHVEVPRVAVTTLAEGTPGGESSATIRARVISARERQRAPTRILRVARTIADLADEDEITTSHLAEAIQYRSLDRRDRDATQFARRERYARPSFTVDSGDSQRKAPAELKCSANFRRQVVYKPQFDPSNWRSWARSGPRLDSPRAQRAAERTRAGSGARRASPGGRRGAGRPSLL